MNRLSEPARVVRKQSESGQRWLVRRAIAAAIGVLALLGIYVRMEYQQMPKGPDPVLRTSQESVPAAPPPAAETGSGTQQASSAVAAGASEKAAESATPGVAQSAQTPSAVPEKSDAKAEATFAPVAAANNVVAAASASAATAVDARQDIEALREAADTTKVEQQLKEARDQADKARAELAEAVKAKAEAEENARAEKARLASQAADKRTDPKGASRAEKLAAAKAERAQRDAALRKQAAEKRLATALARHDAAQRRRDEGQALVTDGVAINESAPMSAPVRTVAHVPSPTVPVIPERQPESRLLGAGSVLEATTVRPPADAERLRERLAASGVAARSDTQVNVGPFPNSAAAREALSRLGDLGYRGSLVGEGRVVNLGSYARPGEAGAAMQAAAQLGMRPVASTVFTVGPFGSADEAEDAQGRMQAVGLHPQRIERKAAGSGRAGRDTRNARPLRTARAGGPLAGE